MLSGRRRKLPRHKRSLYLSAARSWLFNMILSVRVEQGSDLQVELLEEGARGASLERELISG